MENKSKYFCPAPFFHMMIGTHNYAQICCSSTRSEIANMSNETDIMDVWLSDTYKSLRQKMIDGEPLKECQVCYQLEERGSTSDRQRYNKRYGDDAINVESGNNTGKPISFDLRPNNLCNLNCVMCGPDSSSQIVKEVVENKTLYRAGVRPNTKSLHTNTLPILRDNKFDWMDKLEDLIVNTDTPHLKLLGGEPTLIPEHMSIMTKLADADNTKGALEITTNLTNLNNKFVSVLSKFKKVIVSCSVDGIGSTLEYIRHPINYERWRANLQKLIEIRNQSQLKGNYFKIDLHCVLQIYNVYHLVDFINFAEKLRVEHSVPYSFTIAISSGKRMELSALYAPDSDRKIIANKVLTMMESMPKYFIEEARLPAVVDFLLTEARPLYHDRYPLAVYMLKRDIPKNRHLKDSLPELYEMMKSDYDKAREDMLQYVKERTNNE
jgi:MoaA/NifB/PqqE/SkfB family radical SAM enzyme